jgi:hypothetical protein
MNVGLAIFRIKNIEIKIVNTCNIYPNWLFSSKISGKNNEGFGHFARQT